MAFAATKAGMPCSPLGKTTQVSSIKYTCIKSGKKMVWNKGEKISQPATTSQERQVPTMIPAPVKSELDKQNLEFLYKAWREELALPKNPITLNIKYFEDPAFPQKSLTGLKTSINNVLAAYGNLIRPNIRVNIIFSTSYDYEMSAIKSDPEMNQAYLQENPESSNHLWRISQYQDGHALAGGTFPINNHLAFVIYFRLSPGVESKSIRYIGSHETGHLIQWMINDNYPKLLPAWWLEGQAQQIGEVFGSEILTIEEIEKATQVLFLSKNDFEPYSRDGLNFADMEGDPATRTEFGCKLCRTNFLYTRGKHALNYLVSQYGQEAVINFMKTLNTSNLWWQQFEKSFGITVDQFYFRLRDFVTWYGNYYLK